VTIQHIYGTFSSPQCRAAMYEITGEKNITVKYPGEVQAFQVLASQEKAQS
jgi:hypothetical protein